MQQWGTMNTLLKENVRKWLISNNMLMHSLSQNVWHLFIYAENFKGSWNNWGKNIESYIEMNKSCDIRNGSKHITQK